MNIVLQRFYPKFTQVTRVLLKFYSKFMKALMFYKVIIWIAQVPIKYDLHCLRNASFFSILKKAYPKQILRVMLRKQRYLKVSIGPICFKDWLYGIVVYNHKKLVILGAIFNKLKSVTLRVAHIQSCIR